MLVLVLVEPDHLHADWVDIQRKLTRVFRLTVAEDPPQVASFTEVQVSCIQNRECEGGLQKWD